MAEKDGPGPPLQIDGVECTSMGADRLVVRLSGSWQRAPNPDAQAILIIEADGRRHRFPQNLQPRRTVGSDSKWSARFTIPAWLRPYVDGTVTLAIEDSVMEVPPLGRAGVEPRRPDESRASAPTASARAPMPGSVPPTPAPAPAPESAPSASVPAPAPRSAPPTSAPAPGPESVPRASTRHPAPPVPSDTGSGVTLQDGISALRVELKERFAEEARMRRELAELKAQLAVRNAAETQFEQMREELRAELATVREVFATEDDRGAEVESRAMVLAAELEAAREQVKDVAAERDLLRAEVAQLRTAVASSAAARETAIGQATSLQAEIDQLSTELAVVRAQQRGAETGLQDAEALLAEARALTDSLRES